MNDIIDETFALVAGIIGAVLLEIFGPSVALAYSLTVVILVVSTDN